MRIEELILDGFKSYATRTVITGWDAEFNVITGRNGAGKSNVLDAICFVLGISNLQQVRAVSFQELIYKNGKAGITRASVTIVFNNDDAAASPVGFEQVPKISVTRQILMGGKNKYLLNGRIVLQAAVASLFQSAGLNVNNPNFLIMQGQITKVPKMRPAEILALIEEAAGTRMYEERKEKGLRAIAKKDKKIDEIQALLDEEITPKLDRVRAQKRAYSDYMRAREELERLERVAVAHDHVARERRVRRAADELAAARAQLQRAEDDLEAVRAEFERQAAELAAREDAIDADGGAAGGAAGEVAQLELQVKALRKELALNRARYHDARSLADETTSAYWRNKQLLDEADAAVEAAQAATGTGNVKTAELAQRVALQALESARTLLAGTGAGSGPAQSVEARLSELRAARTAAMSAVEVAELQLAKVTARQQREQADAAAAAERRTAVSDQYQTAQRRVIALTYELDEFKGVDGVVERLDAELGEARGRLQELQKQERALARAAGPSVEFQYSDPHAGFDRSQVRGLVAELVTVSNEHASAATALEVCAGGRLFNVVVDTDTVGADLLQHGRLRRRVTLIPLNKIAPFRVAASKLAAAAAAAGDRAQLALRLIGYDGAVSAAMEYVFGGTLVCQDTATAKAVTFDPQIRLRSVTLDGDVYDPSGVLQGGARPSTCGILARLGELRNARAALREADGLVKRLVEELRAARERATTRDQMRVDLEVAEHTKAQLQAAVGEAGASEERLAAIGQQVAAAEQQLAVAQDECCAASLQLETLERDVREGASGGANKRAELEERVRALAAEAESASRAVAAAVEAARVAGLEAVARSEEAKALKEAVAKAKEAEDKAAEAWNQIRGHITAQETTLERRTRELDEARARRAEADRALKALEAAQRTLRRRQQDAEHAVGQRRRAVERLVGELAQREKQLGELEAAHEWISGQRALFGQVGGAFDFAAMDMDEVRRRVRALGEETATLGRGVDERAVEVGDRLEKRETLLKQNMTTIRRDRVKIERTVARLDAFKREALQRTWQAINRDFGSAFAEIFPGNTARLEPPAGCEFTEGLEFRVCIGGVWIDNVGELSGGQCSLVALALLFAILQVKPAPLYILDEVDAALDPSHTQNIGRLIRTRFRGAQFVVVSLKDGLFDNANVKFFATFQNNASCIERHVLRGADAGQVTVMTGRSGVSAR